MSTRPYVPQANSLPSLVVGFFTNNPDEELTLEDITEKFGAQRNNIHTNLALAVQHGLLARARNDDGDYVYRIGKKPPKGADADTAQSAPGKSAAAKRAMAQVDLPDPMDVQIDSDVPLPTANGRGGKKRDWAPLLQRLQPGDSAQLPLCAKFTLANAITAAHKAQQGTYTLRTFPEAQTLRVWRTA